MFGQAQDLFGVLASKWQAHSNTVSLTLLAAGWRVFLFLRKEKKSFKNLIKRSQVFPQTQAQNKTFWWIKHRWIWKCRRPLFAKYSWFYTFRKGSIDRGKTSLRKGILGFGQTQVFEKHCGCRRIMNQHLGSFLCFSFLQFCCTYSHSQLQMTPSSWTTQSSWKVCLNFLILLILTCYNLITEKDFSLWASY